MGKEISISEAYIKQFVEGLRPEDHEIRKQLDFGYSWEKNTAILYTIRPFWNNPNELIQSDFAKIRFTKTTNSSSLYWMRALGKWELYDPHPIANNLQDLLAIIKEISSIASWGKRQKHKL